MEIAFTKLQGNGNDFILIDEHETEVIPEEMKGSFAALYCDRRFGIGADGVLFLQASDKADIRMRLFQPDESEASMCGNGIRCLAKYACDAGYVKESCSVETGAGIVPVTMRFADDEFTATITMPTPAFERSAVPAVGDGEFREEILGFTVYAVNTGVPHAVVFVKEVAAVDVAAVGQAIRNHPTFPEGANVNFVEDAGNGMLRIRTFERGVEGETASCGTGATASAAVARHLGKTGETVRVETKGGPLVIRFGETVTMEGPAETVFTGVIPF
ncbi:diaminopimelate epimerase [Methanoculleus palmolei]|jgi:diaminopimelate epimerase|uniref:Diaminopimelate epimerase n=1 Tax=Methanoculleus palmolei TaxID=72612 RepID=A0ABD8A994_9EURY|nr:diaminopimelate epimerase [Methanoculleus sp. UBA377]WOX56091.1 diaminopimelate epimerase [Methanoculleus palmolei]